MTTAENPSGTAAAHSRPFVFPPWVNGLRPVIGLLAVALPSYGALMLVYGASPRTTDVGYAPVQPVPYSHAVHVGKLGLDCRYCHNTVEVAAHAAIPPTQTCMNCHAKIFPSSEKLTIVRNAHSNGLPIEWVRVHDLPDYVYFDHSAHVRRGVGCVSCHGRIDRMEVVYQENTLSMGWCLDCHRNPDPHLRPLDQITSMTWAAENPAEVGRGIRTQLGLQPSTNCSTCHR